MRILLLTVCFILTACASTPKFDNYIRTTGIGHTYEEAKNNAFKEAIEYQVGVVIASERESYNEKLVKNEILAYSSAFVDEYKIISQQNIGNKVQLVIDVKLSLLRLSDRILSKGKDSKNLDGAKHNNQYKSFLENKQNGDRILASVLNDYPRRAYDIQQRLWSAEKGFAQQYSGTVRIGSEKYYFNEFIITEKILDAMMDWNEVSINMEIKDLHNKTQYSECFKPNQLHKNVGGYYNINYIKTNNIGINTKAGELGKIEMKIQNNSKLANTLHNSSKIELSVVPKKVCVKNN